MIELFFNYIISRCKRNFKQILAVKYVDWKKIENVFKSTKNTAAKVFEAQKKKLAGI